MDREHPAWAAYRMRELDEPMRNALIEQADNVIDIRDRCEREMALPHVQQEIWIELDIEE